MASTQGTVVSCLAGDPYMEEGGHTSRFTHAPPFIPSLLKMLCYQALLPLQVQLHLVLLHELLKV